MTRYIIIIIAAVFSIPAQADAIHMDGVTVTELSALLYGEIMRTNYVMSQAVMDKPDKLRVHVDAKDQKHLQSVLRQVIHDAGIDQESKQGVVHLSLRKDPEQKKEYEIYRTKYRPVSYLSSIVRAALPDLKLAGSAATQSDVAMHPARPQQQSQSSAGHANPPTQLQPLPPQGQPVNQSQNLDLLVMEGKAEDIDKAKKLLAQIDIATPEIMVKAVVYEVSVDGLEKSALGLVADILGGKIGLSAGKIAAGDYSAVFKAGGIQVVFDALNSDRRFKVVSSPSMRVQSGTTARLQVGSETPVLGNAQMDRNGNQVQSIDYKPAGVILDLKPQIRDEVADLQITQQISNFIPTTSGVNGSPTLLKRELSTSVGVRPGDVLVLGGLDEERKTDESAGLPFLPDWLTSKSRQSQKSEILLILQAQRI